MAMLYYLEIMNGNITIDDVPSDLKEEVLKLLESVDKYGV